MPTWMVVEDEPDIYDVLLAMFEIWGIEGVAFVDGGEAVSWIEDVDSGKVTGELPELAILDIRLPEVSGPEVGARLRASTRLGRVAIVMITAYRLTPEEEEQVKARAQADTLMYKPLPAMPELRRTLDQILEKRRKPFVPALPVPAAVPASPHAAAASTPKTGVTGQASHEGKGKAPSEKMPSAASDSLADTGSMPPADNREGRHRRGIGSRHVEPPKPPSDRSTPPGNKGNKGNKP